MNEKQVSILFNEGVLIAALLVLNPIGKGFLLQFKSKNGEFYTLSSFRNDSRVFKTYDQAAKIVKSIGFKKMTVIL